MTAGRGRRLTWSKVGAALSGALIVFGVVDAAVPGRRPGSEQATSAAAPRHGAGITLSASSEAAEAVAQRFITASDSTDPAHPAGDVVTASALAPGLRNPKSVSWPLSWTAEERRTTVVLYALGPPMAEAGGRLTVVVTGVMTVSTDGGPPTEVPLVERVTLRRTPESAVDGSRFLVSGVEAGA